MADLDKRNAKKNSELIRQGIVQCLTLEAECEALRGSLAESQGHGQKLEARIAEMTADREGLMKILAEKDTLIERYNALMSETLDRTLRREGSASNQKTESYPARCSSPTYASVSDPKSPNFRSKTSAKWSRDCSKTPETRRADV
ncbi:hypothetical protein FOYG_15024 [Fusarium oxysporum NRRL 32931]|uniref:Uncharacterized protein n=1 Tax=Fusarium oxysporum NRRL 32931 TaxID=660029 RepID=W9HRW3_FUSOX|nr:hypothetical protein FOYG_15024 [Fusarium oxysporum NRRL 32931]